MGSICSEFHRSRDWTCPHCQQTNVALLPDPSLTKDQEINGTLPESGLTTTTEHASSTEAATDPNFTNSTAASLPPSEAETLGAEPPLTTTSTDTWVSEPSTQPDNVASSTHLNIHHNPSTPPTNPENATRFEASTVPESRRSNRSRSNHNASRSQKPPVLLDTAICILLVLLFAIICRRMV